MENRLLGHRQKNVPGFVDDPGPPGFLAEVAEPVSHGFACGLSRGGWGDWHMLATGAVFSADLAFIVRDGTVPHGLGRSGPQAHCGGRWTFRGR